MRVRATGASTAARHELPGALVQGPEKEEHHERGERDVERGHARDYKEGDGSGGEPA